MLFKFGETQKRGTQAVFCLPCTISHWGKEDCLNALLNFAKGGKSEISCMLFE